MLGEPKNVSGECNARLYLGDNFGDNHTTIRCSLKPEHDGPHREAFTRAGGKVEITWEKDERIDENGVPHDFAAVDVVGHRVETLTELHGVSWDPPGASIRKGERVTVESVEDTHSCTVITDDGRKAEARPWELRLDTEDSLQVHVCRGPSSQMCRCQCPQGPCEHQWDGPVVWEGDVESVACSKCGMTRRSHDLWTMPCVHTCDR